MTSPSPLHPAQNVCLCSPNSLLLPILYRESLIPGKNKRIFIEEVDIKDNWLQKKLFVKEIYSAGGFLPRQINLFIFLTRFCDVLELPLLMLVIEFFLLFSFSPFNVLDSLIATSEQETRKRVDDIFIALKGHCHA